MATRLTCRQLLRKMTEHNAMLAPHRLWIGRQALWCSAPEKLLGATAVSNMPRPRAGLKPVLSVDFVVQTRFKHGAKKGKGSKGEKSGRDGTGENADGEESLDDIAGLPETKARYDRVLEALKTEFHALRGGKPDPGMLDHVEVDSYGSMAPLSTVAQASLKGPQLMVLTVYDPGLTKAVEEAVRNCGMGLNPCSEGQGQVNVPIPKVTKESRVALTKVASKHAEKAKVVVRGIRHKVLDHLKKKKEFFPEDDVHRRLKEIDKCTQDAEANASKLLEKKKADIMAV